jgi:hypothetical protein
MSKKRLIIFGTRHWLAGNAPSDIYGVLKYIIERFRPAIGLEEWCAPELKRVSAFNAQCDAASPRVPWKNIGTSDTAEFTTYKTRLVLNILRYGPLDVQERREVLMCINIRDVMSKFDSGLLVIGEAHLHSMAAKLLPEFEVDAYGYFPPEPREPAK